MLILGCFSVFVALFLFGCLVLFLLCRCFLWFFWGLLLNDMFMGVHKSFIGFGHRCCILEWNVGKCSDLRFEKD